MWRQLSDRVDAGGSGRPLNTLRAVVSPHLSAAASSRGVFPASECL